MMKANIQCPACKTDTMKCVSSQQEYKRARLIARCCYLCGATSHDRIDHRGHKPNARLQNRLLQRAAQFGRDIRAGTLKYSRGLWFPTKSGFQTEVRAAEAKVADSLHQSGGAVVSGIDPELVLPDETLSAPSTLRFDDE